MSTCRVLHDKKHISASTRISKESPCCASCLPPLSTGGTHVAQGGTPSPAGSHDSDSSSGGHSAPSPTGNWSTCLIRERLPLEVSGSTQVLEQGPHSAHSVTWQSFGMTQDWTVSGRSLGAHRLERIRSGGVVMILNTLE